MGALKTSTGSAQRILWEVILAVVNTLRNRVQKMA
jgi:hypothetical protein